MLKPMILLSGWLFELLEEEESEFEFEGFELEPPVSAGCLEVARELATAGRLSAFLSRLIACWSYLQTVMPPGTLIAVGAGAC